MLIVFREKEAEDVLDIFKRVREKIYESRGVYCF